MEIMAHDLSNMSMSMPGMPGSNTTYNNGSMMYMHHMMHMSFFLGKDVVLLFSDWPGSHRLGMYLLALVVVFLLAVAMEILSLASSLRPKRPISGALVHAMVFAVRMGLAYLVMLSVMSYNVGVFVVAVAGHAVGSFVVKYRALAAVDPYPASTA